MEKQETSKKQTEEKVQNPMPLGMILDRAKDDMTKAVITLQRQYGLPASLLDMVLTGVLAEVREMKCLEYRQYGEVESDGNDHNISE